MNSSGIKRGLAVSAVSALAVVGFPALAHAAGLPATTLNVSAAQASATIYQLDEIDVAAADSAGNAPSDASVSATISETLPAADAAPAFAVAAGTTTITPTSVTNADGTVTYTTAAQTVTLAGGDGDITVGSNTAGTVNVKVTAVSGATASASFTVTSGRSAAGNAAAVNKVNASATTLSDYLTDWTSGDSTGALSYSPVDVNGVALGDAPLYYTIYQGTTVVTDATAITPTAAATFAAAPWTSVSPSLAGISAAGTYTVTVWANTSAATIGVGSKPAAGEPVATTTVTILPNSFTTGSPGASNDIAKVGTSASSSVTSVTGAVGGALPAGSSSTVPVTLTLKNTTATPAVVANVPVAFDVYLAGSSLSTRLNGVTDANGKVTFNVPLTAAQEANGNVLGGEFFISKSTNVGVGAEIDATAGTPTTLVTFQTPEATLSLAGGTGLTQVQATPGGTVSIPVVETDQFGNPLTHPITFGSPSKNTGVAAQVITPDAAGDATFTYTDTKSAGAGDSETVSVKDATTGADFAAGGLDGGAVTVNYVASVTPAAVQFVAGTGQPSQTAAGAGVNVSASTTAGATAGTDPVYTVTVTNANGSPMVNSPVVFSVDKGFISDSASDKATAKSVTVYTDVNGQAKAYAGSETAGAQTVTATDGGISTAAAYPFVWDALGAYSLTVTGPSAPIATGMTGTFTATVTDEFGNPLQGQSLTFEQSGAGAFTSGASTSTVTTGTDGSVTVSLQALNTAGTGTLSVTAPITATTADPDATVALTPATASVNYTVAAAKPAAKPKLNKVTAPNNGKKANVLTFHFGHANGTRYVKVNGKQHTLHVKNGVARLTLKDTNGAKVTKYTVKFRGQTKVIRVK